MSLQLFAELGIGNGLVVSCFEEAIEDVIADVVVSETAEGARRRGALSNAFYQIHSPRKMVLQGRMAWREWERGRWSWLWCEENLSGKGREGFGVIWRGNGGQFGQPRGCLPPGAKKKRRDFRKRKKVKREVIGLGLSFLSLLGFFQTETKPINREFITIFVFCKENLDRLQLKFSCKTKILYWLNYIVPFF